VSGSVGIDVKRGDSLEIKNMEFIEQDFETVAKQMAEQEKRSYVRNLILYSVIGLGILLFFIFAVRPFIKWMTENTIESVDTFLPQTLEELEKLQKSGLMSGMQDVVPVVPDSVDPEKVEGEVIKEKIISIIEANPDKAALVIKEWIAPVAAKKDEDGKKEANA
jgi:flagellar M-ring protein FliF